MKPTQEQAKYFLPFVQALAEGKVVEFKRKALSHWEPLKALEDWLTDSDYNLYDFRVKPEPKLRPWKPEEVPVGALVRDKGSMLCSVILGIHNSLLVTCNGKYRLENEAAISEHSLDHGKTWLPCGVLEE